MPLLGGLLGSVLTQPIDYVKTQQQRSNDKRSILTILRETSKDNYKKLYIGGFYRALLSICSMGIGFIAYEYFTDIIEDRTKKNIKKYL